MLRALHDAQVEFVVVGGLAAVLDGAPINTLQQTLINRFDAAVAQMHPPARDGGRFRAVSG
jgi:hypothetical protein